MWQLIIAAGFLVGEYIYHYYDKGNPPPPARAVELPRNDEGAPVPIFYGRCRINAPIVAAITTPNAVNAAPLFPGRYLYFMDILAVLGIPCDGGRAQIFNMYAGDFTVAPLADGVAVDGDGVLFVAPEALTGDGGFEDDVRPCAVDNTTIETRTRGGIEFLNGNAAQTLVDPATLTATTVAGRLLLGDSVTAAAIAGFRKYATVFLYGVPADLAQLHWVIGTDARLGAYSFEAGSYPHGHMIGGGSLNIGDDMNPVGVLIDLLIGTFGKLGIDPARIDTGSFSIAAATLFSEKHGYSHCFDQAMTVGEMIGEVLAQIDGLLFFDERTGTIKLKLIRPDYDFNALPHITPENCVDIQNFASGGWVDIVNRVRVTYTDRQSNYKEGSAVAENHANAVGQDNGVNEIQLSMPGITNSGLAADVASRELQARSRPLMKCRAIVNRSFLRVLPGDPVKLTWPEANISGIVFRVANVSRGTLENGAIALDLIQDYFYQHRDFVGSIGTVALGINTSKPAI